MNRIPSGTLSTRRCAAKSRTPERITFHNSRVSFPTFLNDETLLYLATAEDGSGPWLHAVGLTRRASHRVNTGGQEYASVSASADGRRLVGTAARSMSSLWRVPVGDGAIELAGS